MKIKVEVEGEFTLKLDGSVALVMSWETLRHYIPMQDGFAVNAIRTAFHQECQNMLVSIGRGLRGVDTLEFDEGSYWGDRRRRKTWKD